MTTSDLHTISTSDPGLGTNARIEEIRADFPILQERVHGHQLVYLDNASTTQKPFAVINRIREYYEHENSNVHRGVHSLSQIATEEYESARSTLKEFVGARTTSEIVFTRGTTEAINLVASSFAKPELGEGDEILLTRMEHHSNIVPWQMACEETGATLRVIPIDDDGTLIYEEFERLLSDRTRILALTHVSNTLGTVNPVKRMIRDAHGLNIPVLIDGAQTVPHMPVDVIDLDCDFYCFSGHKMFGPTGIGVLYGKEALLDAMRPYQGGGDMIESVSFERTTYNELPHKFEAGTPNIVGALGLAAAVEYLREIGFDLIREHERNLLVYARERLSQIDGIRFIGDSAHQAAVVSVLLGSTHPYDVGTILDRMGIAVRTGHHCTQPLMRHYGIPGTVRASFAFYNTLEEIDSLVEALQRVAVRGQ